MAPHESHLLEWAQSVDPGARSKLEPHLQRNKVYVNVQVCTKTCMNLACGVCYMPRHLPFRDFGVSLFMTDLMSLPAGGYNLNRDSTGAAAGTVAICACR